MISKENAEKFLLSKLATGLTIDESWESEDNWCFSLAFVEDGEKKPLLWNKVIRINKVTGEME